MIARSMFKKTIIIFLIAFVLAVPNSLLAAPNEALGQQGVVSINFDDGLLGTYTLAAPLMAEYGFKGTAYVYTQPLNEKEPGYYDEFMSWANVVALQNNFGWEIGSHTETHADLTSISLADAKKEINRSRNQLIKHGLNVQSFASPYGAYNDAIVDYLTKNFNSHRTAWNLPNTWPINDYYLKTKTVLPTTSVAEVKSWIDQAKANNEWLILLFHDLTAGTAQPQNDDYGLDDFKEILNYIQSSNLPVMTNTAALNSWSRGDNLVTNGSFESGTLPNADGWIRSATAGVNVVANNRGVYPAPKRSVTITGANKQRSISTVEIPVVENTNYRLKAFYRVSNYTSGDSTVWVSEFNENYGYLGGQWLGGLNYNFLGTRYFDYIPSSGTRYIEIFFLTHANSKMKFKVDGVELKEL